MSIPSASSISSITLIGDASHPLYLHHGDSLGSLLVSQMLNGENYNSWRRSMIMALTAKNKLEFVDGTLVKLLISPDDPFIPPWIRCNNMVLSWIMNYVSKEIDVSII